MKGSWRVRERLKKKKTMKKRGERKKNKKRQKGVKRRRSRRKRRGRRKQKELEEEDLNEATCMGAGLHRSLKKDHMT